MIAVQDGGIKTMHICYKGDDLLKASDMLQQGTFTWASLVNTAYDAMEIAYQDETWQGKAADCFKSYYQDIHGSFATVFFELVKLFSEKCKAYVAEYLTVDGADHAVIDTDELADIITHIVFRVQDTHAVDNAVREEIKSVNDITSINYDSKPAVFGQLDKMRTDVTNLQKAVWDEETRFVTDGFPVMQELVDSLKKLINSGNAVKVSSDNRSVAYDPNALKETFKDVASAYEHAGEYEDAHATDFAKNDKILQDAIDRRQEELNQRKALAIGVGIVVAAIGIAATVVTCGAAGPVATIAIGAVVGAVSGAATSVANQNVGDIYGRGEIKGKEVFKEAVIGGVTGAVTSATGLGSARAVAATASCAHPVAAKIAIKAGESVINGIVTRGVGTGIRQESFGAGVSDAFDPRKFAADAAGSVVSTVAGEGVDKFFKKTGIDQKMKDNRIKDYAWTVAKDEVTDASKRFVSTTIKTGDVKEGLKKAGDGREILTTGIKTVVGKGTEDVVASKKDKFDKKSEEEMTKVEKWAKGFKDNRIEKQSSKDRFQDQQFNKIKDKLADEYGKRYDEGVAAGKKYGLTRENYVKSFSQREANRAVLGGDAYRDAAKKWDNNNVSKEFQAVNKNAVKQASDNAKDIYEKNYTAPNGEYDARQEDKDHLLNYNH